MNSNQTDKQHPQAFVEAAAETLQGWRLPPQHPRRLGCAVSGGQVKRLFSRALIPMIVAALTLAVCAVPAHAEDLTVFGGIQHQGKLTFETAPGSATNFVKTFDPKNFGVFGARFSHGKLIRGEHTLAYAPNFIESGDHALIYHSNVLIQAPLPIVKPYGTAGLGLIHSGGSSVTSFGTKFTFNYGGGVKVMAGPVGVDLDLRGYTVPGIGITGFPQQQRLDFFQVSAGLVFAFK